ncbi:MAG: helix-turn-helix domain-containing protein, partial [Pseudonocardiaceae bacterium]
MTPVGIGLIVEVLDQAPAELTAQERLLLVVIAENANDDTRVGWPGMPKLTHRLGRGDSTVRKIVRQLAERGYDPRVPVGTDKNGKPIYAHKGQSAVYRVPDFRRDSTDPKASPRGA